MNGNDISNDSMLELYVFEATGLLDQLDDILLQSEPDNRLESGDINEIFRIMHTLKGSAAMMSFDLISRLSHSTENLFSIIRNNHVPQNNFEDIFELVLQVSDFLKDEIKKIQAGATPTKNNHNLENKIRTMIDKFTDKGYPEGPPIHKGRILGAPGDTEDMRTYCLHVYFSEGSKMENIRAFMLVNKLEDMGTVNESIPADLENNAEASEYIVDNGFYINFTTAMTREEIETVSKSTLSVESVSFIKKMPKVQNVTENSEPVSEDNEEHTDELQDIVMSVKLVPISSIFQRMKRVVRDMNRQLKKEAELVLVGGNTEIDKTILNALEDPIMHLVRNAMDHGLEDAEEREKSGKNFTGHIILSAQNTGGDIIISVSDDGRGLDPQSILAEAKAKKLLSKPENEYTDREIFNFLMEPGFSTKETVTEFSGRGVGMDVVKTNIKDIGGSVIIESVRGIGTNIFLKIPTTLATIQCVEVKIGGNVFCIPISNIKESFMGNSVELIRDPDDNELILLRGTVYPVIRLHRLYDVKTATEELDRSILILVDSGEKMGCLMVDKLMDKSQVVVKPLPPYIGGFNVKEFGISGCTILGDGSISLILDVMEILS